MDFPRHFGMKEGQTGGGQVPEAQLTWGATIVQSLANSTCPERAKTMMFRKLVNHITHSKSATSWTAGAGSSKAVRAVEPEEPIRAPAPCSEDRGYRCLPSL